jgi:hypothetical protein
MGRQWYTAKLTAEALTKRSPHEGERRAQRKLQTQTKPTRLALTTPPLVLQFQRDSSLSVTSPVPWG